MEKTPEDFVRVKIMLHYPFRDDVSNLLSTLNQDFMDWTVAYQHCCNAHIDTHSHFSSDGFRDPVQIVDEEDDM
jgi:hypothetical protein